MTDWIPIDREFIQADVLRWHEAVFSKAKRRGARAIKIGTREVIAEVLREEDPKGLVLLLVRGCEGSSEMVGTTIETYRKGTEIRRARRTIMRGEPERLVWSDETARTLVASRFLGNREPPLPPTRPKKGARPKNRPRRTAGAKGRPARARPSPPRYDPAR